MKFMMITMLKLKTMTMMRLAIVFGRDDSDSVACSFLQLMKMMLKMAKMMMTMWMRQATS